MNKTLIMAAVSFLLCAHGLNGEDFELKRDGNSVIIKTSAFTVRTSLKMHFTLSSEYGVNHFDRRTGGEADSLKVAKDTENVKRVEITSSTFNYGKEKKLSYFLNLEARKGLPFLFVETGIRNNGDKPAYCYYFLRCCPCLSDTYVNTYGEIKVRQPDVKFDQWLFLPNADSTGGLALVIDNPVTTLYPREDWRKCGWYFPVNSKHRQGTELITTGNANTLDFICFPAEHDEKEIQAKLAFSDSLNIINEKSE